MSRHPRPQSQRPSPTAAEPSTSSRQKANGPATSDTTSSNGKSSNDKSSNGKSSNAGSSNGPVANGPATSDTGSSNGKSSNGAASNGSVADDRPRSKARRKSGSALSTSRLTKTYGDRPALEPLDLDVEVGEHVALVGHNGSGKTTLLKMVAGLLDPSDGSVSVGGHESGSEGARRALSWLSDSPTFYDDLSLWEHLEYVARLHGVEDWEASAESLVERVGLSERRNQIPTTFSRGLRQKAAITLACVRPFDVLVVDEPFVGLDEIGKAALLGLLDEASGRGATLLIATHELSFVTRVDRLLALRDGQLTYDGAPAGIDVHALVMPS